MKRIICVFFVLFGVMLHAEEPRLLTVLFTNDSHGMAWAFDEQDNPDVGGLAARKTLVERIRRDVQLQNGDVVLVSSGNITMGDPRSNVCENLPIVKGMNLIGYDGMAIGNHEFDFGMRIFRKMKKESRFPFLSANIYARGGRKLLGKPSVEKELVNGVRVAFIGITSPKTQQISNAGVEGHIVVKDPVSVTTDLVRKLRQKNDFIIALSNLGYSGSDNNRDDAPDDRLLAEKVPGLDLIIGGHTKRHMEKPVIVNKTPIVQTEGLGKWLGRYDFFFSGKKLVKTEFTLYPVNMKHMVQKDGKKKYEHIGRKLKKNKAMLKMLNSFNCDFSTQVIGEIAQPLDGDRQVVRYGTSPLGVLITDILRDRTGTDTAFLNAGSIRQGLRDGYVNEMDVYSVFPFDDTIVTGTMKGTELRALLEEFAAGKKGEGGYLQMSGVTCRISNGEVADILVDGKPLNDSAEYSFAANSFLADGGDGYETFSKLRKKQNTGHSVPGAIVTYIKREKYIENPDASGEKQIGDND